VLTLLAIAVLAGSVLGLGLSWAAARLLTQPLARLRDGIGALARGDLRVRIPPAGGDEIGQTLSSLSDTVTSLHGMVSSIHASSAGLNAKSAELSGIAGSLAQVESDLAES